MTLRLSIITPTLNRLALLREAVDSVRRQDQKHFEHIIVDGGSADGSLDWVRSQPDLTLITGADRGVYDALNIGIASARGEIIGLLNSDDRYLEGAFAVACEAFGRNPEAEVATGSADIVENDRIVATHAERLDGTEGLRDAFLGVCLPNACFYRRDLFDRIGMFNPDWRLISDRDLFLRIIAAKVPSVAIERRVYAYLRHASSLTFDPGRAGAIALRRELLQLAIKWQASSDQQVRHLARVLEGRSRLGLVRDGLRLGSLRAVTNAVSAPGRASVMPISILTALFDRLVAGSTFRPPS